MMQSQNNNMINNRIFGSEDHKLRFRETMEHIGKISDGKLDPEYGSAVFVLTALPALWRKTQEYVGSDRIDFTAILEEIDLSGGESVLVRWAGSLFNGSVHVDPVELIGIDQRSCEIALTAFRLRRDGVQVDNLKDQDDDRLRKIAQRNLSRYRTMKRLDAEQIQTLQDAFRGHRLEALIRLALVTGMRRAELLSLKWQEVDLEKRELRFQDLRTKNWECVSLPDEIALLLKHHHLAQRKEQDAEGITWANLDLVFPDRHGNLIHPYQLMSEFGEVAGQAGLTGICFHDLRATVKHMRISEYKTKQESQ